MNQRQSSTFNTLFYLLTHVSYSRLTILDHLAIKLYMISLQENDHLITEDLTNPQRTSPTFHVRRVTGASLGIRNSLDTQLPSWTLSLLTPAVILKNWCFLLSTPNQKILIKSSTKAKGTKDDDNSGWKMCSVSDMSCELKD